MKLSEQIMLNRNYDKLKLCSQVVNRLTEIFSYRTIYKSYSIEHITPLPFSLTFFVVSSLIRNIQSNKKVIDRTIAKARFINYLALCQKQKQHLQSAYETRTPCNRMIIKYARSAFDVIWEFFMLSLMFLQICFSSTPAAFVASKFYAYWRLNVQCIILQHGYKTCVCVFIFVRLSVSWLTTSTNGTF